MLKVRGPSREFLLSPKSPTLSPKSPTLSPSRQNGRQICRQGRQFIAKVAKFIPKFVAKFIPKFVANISISGKRFYSFVTSKPSRYSSRKYGPVKCRRGFLPKH
ncbi:hypothetical protein AVEN_220078-1 [Araneus ventricosus]|uniref:Uncharacterized protein n=1 Tax=Araneus ventricosus TaxID=182803 RepID=A0A4Y2NSX5_ARAVE|nr:hypothetical protein AVEN_220078-1 [Araneus ventricosus]